jgi:predicted Zn-dependent protease
VLYSMALIQMDLGHETEAEQLLHTLADQRLGDPRLYRLMGRLQAKQGHLEAAAESYHRAIDLQPNVFDAARELFFLYWDEKKDRQAALGVLQDWIGRHPEDKQIQRALAVYSDSAKLLEAH